jgi:hypothetical protein
MLLHKRFNLVNIFGFFAARVAQSFSKVLESCLATTEVDGKPKEDIFVPPPIASSDATNSLKTITWVLRVQGLT